MIKKILMTCGVVVLLAACSDPITTTHTVDSRPSVVVMNAPAESTFSVDGIAIGKVNESQSALVEPGKHVIKVYNKLGTLIHSEKFFVSGSVLHKIVLPRKTVK